MSLHISLWGKNTVDFASKKSAFYEWNQLAMCSIAIVIQAVSGNRTSLRVYPVCGQVNPI